MCKQSCPKYTKLHHYNNNNHDDDIISFLLYHEYVV